MGYNQNDPSYLTKNSKVLNFNDFGENIEKEKEELKKSNRNLPKFDSEVNQIPGEKVKKYNRVTHKLDDVSKAELQDKIDAIEDMGVKDPKHKYKAEIPTQQSSNESILTASEFIKLK